MYLSLLIILQMRLTLVCTKVVLSTAYLAGELFKIAKNSSKFLSFWVKTTLWCTVDSAWHVANFNYSSLRFRSCISLVLPKLSPHEMIKIIHFFKTPSPEFDWVPTGENVVISLSKATILQRFIEHVQNMNPIQQILHSKEFVHILWSP